MKCCICDSETIKKSCVCDMCFEKGKQSKSINDLSQDLEDRINEKMEVFADLGKKVKDTSQLVQDYQQQMYNILLDLQNVEYIVRHQNPEMCQLFDALKKEFGNKNIDKEFSKESNE